MSGVPNLRLYLHIDRRIVGRMPHMISGMKYTLLTVYFAVDLQLSATYIHGSQLVVCRS